MSLWAGCCVQPLPTLKPSRFPCVSKISCFGNHWRGSPVVYIKCAGYLFLQNTVLDLQTRGSVWQNVQSVLNLPIFGNDLLSLSFSRFPIALHRWISACPLSLLYKLENDYLDYVSNQSSLNFNHQTLLKCTETLTESLPKFRNATWHFQCQCFHSSVCRWFRHWETPFFLHMPWAFFMVSLLTSNHASLSLEKGREREREISKEKRGNSGDC